MEEQKKQVEGIREAFKAKFERFAEIRSSAHDLKLATAVALAKELAEFKTAHTGKKSAIAEAKKLIGKVDPEERGRFGQLVQSVEREINEAISDVEAKLNQYISQTSLNTVPI